MFKKKQDQTFVFLFVYAKAFDDFVEPICVIIVCEYIFNVHTQWHGMIFYYFRINVSVVARVGKAVFDLTGSRFEP